MITSSLLYKINSMKAIELLEWLQENLGEEELNSYNVIVNDCHFEHTEEVDNISIENENIVINT